MYHMIYSQHGSKLHFVQLCFDQSLLLFQFCFSSVFQLHFKLLVRHRQVPVQNIKVFIFNQDLIWWDLFAYCMLVGLKILRLSFSTKILWSETFLPPACCWFWPPPLSQPLSLLPAPHCHASPWFDGWKNSIFSRHIKSPTLFLPGHLHFCVALWQWEILGRWWERLNSRKTLDQSNN